MKAGITRLSRTAPQMVLIAFLITVLSMSAFGATNTVSCTSSITFSPSSVTINVNDTIHWSWAGNSHSTTSTNVPSLWDSGIHSQPFDFFFKFTSPGTFGYHCSNPSHSSMKGQVTVVGAGNNPPSVTITNPANGAVFNAPATFTVGATASDSDGSVTNVQFQQGSTILTNKITAPFGVGVTNLAAGSYLFSAVASDNSGAKTTNSISITVNALPSVTVTNPASGALFNAPASFTVGAMASDSDGSITNVQFLQGSTVLANDTTVPYSAAVANLAAGNYTFSAIASDNNGAKTTNSIALTVNAFPSVTITNPVSGATFAAPWSGPINVIASDSDGSIANVQLLSDGAPLGIVSNAPYSFNVIVPPGHHTLAAVAMDNRGATNTSPPADILVVTPAPIILGDAARPSATQFQFSYSANPGLSYVVERGADLASFVAMSTNVAALTNVVVTDSNATNVMNFYRVSRLPNP